MSETHSVHCILKSHKENIRLLSKFEKYHENYKLINILASDMTLENIIYFFQRFTTKFIIFVSFEAQKKFNEHTHHRKFILLLQKIIINLLLSNGYL